MIGKGAQATGMIAYRRLSRKVNSRTLESFTGSGATTRAVTFLIS